MNYYKNIVSELIINPQTNLGVWFDEQSECKRITGTYLYDGNRFSIIGIIGALPTSTGIYPCTILGFPENKGTFYLWTCKNNRTHGLVVLNNDKNSIKRAAKYYRERLDVF
jgi:hypothetical protein